MTVMTDTRMITVVMPTYNGSRFLDRAIDSMQAQTHTDWELVVVDDASTDETRAKLDAWSAADARIRVLGHGHNRGLPAALNTGVAAMRGSYFTWLSDDDLFRPEALATMLAFLEERPEVDAVYTDYSEVDEHGTVLRSITVEPADLLGIGNPIGVCHLRRASVFERVGNYAEDLFLAEDLDMWIRLHRSCRVEPLHQDLFLYRQHARSLTTTAARRVYPVHERILDRHADGMPWLGAGGLAWAYVRLARLAHRNQDRRGFTRLLAKSIRHDPTFIVRKLTDRVGGRRFGRTRPSGTADTAERGPADAGPALLWVYTEPPAATLDAATWIETTRELRQLGWDAALIAPGPTGPAEIRGVEIDQVERPDRYLIGQAAFHLGVARTIWRRRDALDVVLFHEMSAIWLLPLRGLLGLVPGRRPRFVMDTRTLHMTAAERQDTKDKIRRVLYGVADRAARSLADGRTAITDRMADAVEIPDAKLWGVWPSGVNPRPFADAAAARRYPTVDEPVRVVYVGSLEQERNVTAVVRAVGSIREQGADIELLLVGRGGELAALTAMAERYDWLTVIPGVPHEEIPDHLATAHVGILPFPDELKFRVSSPIKLFEYVASGLSIMATRIACHTEVLAGTDTPVFWIDGDDDSAIVDALGRLWAERGQLEAGARRSLDATAAFTWHRSAAALDTALRSGLGLGTGLDNTTGTQERP